MNIVNYNPKQLPYNFVLFYGDSSDKHFLSCINAFDGNGDENALLTYCYIDSMCGISYRAIALGIADKNGKVRYITNNSRTMLILREGSITGEAVILDKDDIPPIYWPIADEIKDNYGFHEEMVKIDENIIFDEYRYPMDSRDVFVEFIDEDRYIEKMWVREVERTDEYVIGTLLDSPYNDTLNLSKGDRVMVIPMSDDQTKKVRPVALLDWMKPYLLGK